ncbi:MAG TPA: hypothetical protein VI322_01840 [Candidatus Saccharimonadia bacterium]
MTTYLLYNLGTPAGRWANETAEALKQEQVSVELLDADSPRGIELAQHYDVLGRPAIVMVRDDGSPVQVWQGQDGLPQLADVVYYAHT